MKLPDNFPKLEEPNFILSEPVWVQYLAVCGFLLFGIGSGFLLYHSLFIEKTPLWAICILIIIFPLFISVPFSNDMWKRWALFAADKKGCYFRCNWKLFGKKDFYIFIPWENIGESSIGYVSDNDSTSKSVILKIMVSDDIWGKKLTTESYNPKWADFLKTQKDENGYRKFPLGNHCRNVEKTREAIEKMRSLSKKADNNEA